MKMVLTQCLLDEVLQSVGHVGGTRRRVLHSGNNLFFDGVDDKQQPVCRCDTINTTLVTIPAYCHIRSFVPVYQNVNGPALKCEMTHEVTTYRTLC